MHVNGEFTFSSTFDSSCTQLLLLHSQAIYHTSSFLLILFEISRLPLFLLTRLMGSTLTTLADFNTLGTFAASPLLTPPCNLPAIVSTYLLLFMYMQSVIFDYDYDY